MLQKIIVFDFLFCILLLVEGREERVRVASHDTLVPNMFSHKCFNLFTYLNLLM